MTRINDLQSQPDQWGPNSRIADGISCVGLLLLLIIVLSTLGIGLGTAAAGRRSDVVMVTASSSPTMEPTPTENPLIGIRKTQQSATPQTPDTATPAPPPSNTPTDTSTKTPTSTSTSTSTPTPTPEDTPTMTNTPIPTSTPTPTPTATPTPLPTPSGSFSSTLRVPILMYHYVSTPPEDADEYRLDLSVSPEIFRQHMTYLYDHGYNTIDLYELSRAIANQEELPPNPVVITLDDGYRDNYENAFPVLEEFGMTATFFVVTDFIDQGLPEYMTWAMIEEMAQAGMRFEPHSKTHPDLRGQDRNFVIYQVLGSRETLEAHLDYRPRYFNYPSGRYDEQVLDILAELDYWGAVTTAGGIWHGFNDRYEWSRVRIRNVTHLEEFIDLIE